MPEERLTQNKLLGFYTLHKLSKEGVPCILAKEFTSETVLDNQKLWTIRSANTHFNDFYLPKIVGVTGSEGTAWARNVLSNNSDLTLFYYPYFLAEKSGTLMVKKDSVIIEAVSEDLWNFMEEGKKDITLRIQANGERQIDGDFNFLSEAELDDILSYVNKIRMSYRDPLLAECYILMEWSFAIDTNLKKEPIGAPHLIFFEFKILQK